MLARSLDQLAIGLLVAGSLFATAYYIAEGNLLRTVRLGTTLSVIAAIILALQ